MAQVTRFDPMRFDPLTDLVDDLFKGFFVRPVYQGENAQGRTLRLKVDVAESNGAYVVTAELPGVKKEDIQVTIDGAQVTLTGEAKRDREAAEGERVLHTERGYGKFARTFTLPQEIDQEKADAKFRDGLLELSLPKKADNARRQLQIH